MLQALRVGSLKWTLDLSWAGKTTILMEEGQKEIMMEETR